MRVLLFAGAGTSVELGVPAMAGMATEFLSHAAQWSVEPDLVKHLMGDALDVEALIERLDQICSARESLGMIGTAPADLERVATIRSEVEWFVQHAAERVNPRDAHLVWGPLLRAVGSHELNFVTTNYDRAIELAANIERVLLVDGFAPFNASEVADWDGFAAELRAPRLIKLHGSTDWYAALHTGAAKKLRHPMPLFGRASLHLSSNEVLGSSLILPSREKLLTRPPYPRMTQAFLNGIDGCDLAVFVGSSLRDQHVREAASSAAKTRPVFIVNRQGSTVGIPGARVIGQPASQFLASTLPSALRSADTVAELCAWEGVVPDPRSDGFVGYLRVALDTGAGTVRRCEAIEALDNIKVRLDLKTLAQLVADSDATVSRYALGLIPDSDDRDQLHRLAKEAPHAAEAEYADELGLLAQMLSRKDFGPA